MDSLYELKSTLKMFGKPFVWIGETYALGVRTVIDYIRADPIIAGPVRRPPRNYGAEALARARDIFPREFIRTVKEIGMDNDTVFLARLRTLPLAIAGGHSFDAIWDDAMDDERLTEPEKQALSVQAIEMLERDMVLEGVL